MKNQRPSKGKDPAFLFYSSDFLTGTMLMTDEQVGKYIRLMCLQHQRGHLSEKDMLSICKAYDEDVLSKFKKDDEGKYYSERLEYEINRRIAYTESRRKNALNPKKEAAHDEHMPEHMENENENDTVTDSIQTLSESPKVEEGKAGSKKFVPPTVEEVIQYFAEKGYSEAGAREAHEYYSLNNWRDKDNNPVRAWKQKMFANWLKDKYKIKGANVYPMQQRKSNYDPYDRKNYWNDADYEAAMKKLNAHAS